MYYKEFVNIFNEYYPLERYIIRKPVSIGTVFGDVMLTEIFVPYTEIKPIVDENNKFHGDFTKINKKEVYVKLKCDNTEYRFSIADLSDTLVENIIYIFIDDFDAYNIESLYVDREDNDYSELKAVLDEEAKLITEKYGICNIKKAVRQNLLTD